jgi:hypothetical protein
MPSAQLTVESALAFEDAVCDHFQNGIGSPPMKKGPCRGSAQALKDVAPAFRLAPKAAGSGLRRQLSNQLSKRLAGGAAFSARASAAVPQAFAAIARQRHQPSARGAGSPMRVHPRRR